MARKPRSDSRLLNLPGQIQAALRDRLALDNVSFKEARAWLAREHGVQTSVGALHDFYGKHCFAFRFNEARQLADELKQTMHNAPDVFDGATTNAIAQMLFEFTVAKSASPKEISTLASTLVERARLALEAKKLSLSERRVVLLEKKAAAFDELKAAAGKPGGPSEQTMAEIEARLKLL